MTKPSLIIKAIISITILWSFSVCADHSVDADPFENLNRKVFSFNKYLDDYIARPAAKFYVAVTPEPIEKGVSNFFDNLGEITNIFNAVLQAKFSQAVKDSGRFTINTTLGVAGVFDVAKSFGLRKSEGEDFGQTLGKWGVPEGPYVMLPFLGPTTFRDGPARLIDDLTDPLDYLNKNSEKAAATVVKLIDTRASLLEYDSMLAGDSYMLVRDVYLQKRAYAVSDGAVEDEFDELDDY